jgi:glucosamine-6-phosphate deaminase
MVRKLDTPHVFCSSVAISQIANSFNIQIMRHKTQYDSERVFAEIMSLIPPLVQQIDRLPIEIYPDPTNLVTNLVDRTQRYLQAVIDRQGSATIILASGSSQIQFLKTLTAHPHIDWSKITCFHLDEYLGLSADHPASFQCYMQELVASQVPLKKFHYLDSASLEPITECRRYGKLLAAQPIDLCLLGIGDNGHIAFNDPLVANFTDPDPVKIVRLAEKSRQQQVDVGFFTELNQVPQYAMTLTIPSICRAQQIYCVATGERKAAIVQQLLTAHVTSQLPGTILRQQSQATLYLDNVAASLL